MGTAKPASRLNKHQAGGGITPLACWAKPAGVPQGISSSYPSSATSPTQAPPPQGFWPGRAPHSSLGLCLPLFCESTSQEALGVLPTQDTLLPSPWEEGEAHDLMPLALPLWHLQL